MKKRFLVFTAALIATLTCTMGLSACGATDNSSSNTSTTSTKQSVSEASSEESSVK